MIDNTVPVYQIRNLTKEYDNRQVLNVESLDIFHGEILSLVGPSGSGKSTLLRLLNFLESPTSGKILFKDIVFKTGQEMGLETRRQVTTVFQRPMLLDRSVLDNVIFGLRLRGQKDTKEFSREILDEVGLTSRSHQRARTLSGGEAQRVALARAMVIQPEVLLLDEPAANLDPYNVGLIESIIRRLNREQGTTLVLVTHNVFQAKRLADRVVLLLDGKVIEVAETNRFFQSPADLRTQSFVRGEMVY